MTEKGIVSEILRSKTTKLKHKDLKEEVRRTSICLPEWLHRKLKVRAAEEGRPLNDLMVELLEKALKELPECD